MIRRAMAAALVALAAAAAAPAQAPVLFRWQAGQVLVYRVEHATVLTDVAGESKDETRTRLQLTRRWQVLDVEPNGVATLQMSLASLVYDSSRQGSKLMHFDSSDLEKSTPELVEQNRRYLNGPLVVLRVDPQGKVLEVKDSKIGTGNFECDPPFVALLPADGVKAGQKWERQYHLTLAPPAGLGEKYPVMQHYACTALADGTATIAVRTEAGEVPESADPVPLWQAQQEGEVVFDTEAGRLKSAVMKIDKEQKAPMGEGTTRFQSTYIIQYSGER
jgi:hypothetical protein